MKRKILDWFHILFHPSFWMMNESYCKEWDVAFNHLMDENTFKTISIFTAYLGSCEIWIANYPYAAFCPRNYMKLRPSRRTILRAHKKLIHDLILQGKTA